MANSHGWNRIALVIGLCLSALVISADSTARFELSSDFTDHQRIINELTTVINNANFQQDIKITELQVRQAINVERVRVLEDRFWQIMVGIFLSLVASGIAATFSYKAHARSSRDDWDIQETRTRQHRQKDQPESD
jgi:hypothetical protein